MNFFEVFPPVSRYSTLRLAIEISVTPLLVGTSLDIKTAFLSANLDEEIYLMQEVAFEKAGSENLLYSLLQALYGLKQASRKWNKTLHDFFQLLGFLSSWADPSLYSHCNEKGVVLIVVHVDDLFITGSDKAKNDLVLNELSTRFETRETMAVKKFLIFVVEEIPMVIKPDYSGMTGRN